MHIDYPADYPFAALAAWPFLARLPGRASHGPPGDRLARPGRVRAERGRADRRLTAPDTRGPHPEAPALLLRGVPA